MGGRNSKNSCKSKQLIQAKSEKEGNGGAADSKCPVKMFKKRSAVQWACTKKSLGCCCWSTKCCLKSPSTNSQSATTDDYSASSPSKSSSAGGAGAGECPFKPRKPCAETEHAALLLNAESSALKCPFAAASPASICRTKAGAAADTKSPHHHRVEFVESPMSALSLAATSKCPVSASSSCNSLSAEFYDFNEKEKRLLSLSFEMIKHDLNTVGVIAFMKSFETLPIMKDSFTSLKDIRMDELSTSHALRTHSQKVMRVIGEFVAKLQSNEADKLKEKLTGLGSRHCIYGAKKDHLIIIENQFIHSIRPILVKELKQPGTRAALAPLLTPDFTKLATEDTQNVEDVLSVLSDEEIERTLQVIDNQWHNVFRSIRKCMMAAY